MHRSPRVRPRAPRPARAAHTNSSAVRLLALILCLIVSSALLVSYFFPLRRSALRTVTSNLLARLRTSFVKISSPPAARAFPLHPLSESSEMAHVAAAAAPIPSPREEDAAREIDAVDTNVMTEAQPPSAGAAADTDASLARSTADDAFPVCAWAAAMADPEASIRWSVRDDKQTEFPFLEGAVKLHVENCDLSWRVAAARRCLRRLGHVVFVGDSVSRLLYISLVHFLHTGSWSAVDGGVPSDSPKHWSKDGVSIDFPAYFRGVAARLDGAEICDCNLDPSHVENRYFAAHGLRLSYATFFKRAFPLVFHDPAWLNASCGADSCTQAGCVPGMCAAPDARRFEVAGLHALDSLTSLLLPDTLILNVGVHEPPGAWEDDETIAALTDLTATVRETAPLRTSAALADAWSRVKSGSKAVPAAGTAAPPATETAEGSSAFAERRGLVWRRTLHGKNFAHESNKAYHERVGAGGAREPPLGETPRAPAAPWPRNDGKIAEAVTAAGGRVFDADALVWPLLSMLDRDNAIAPAGSFFEKGRRLNRAWAHETDVWHFSPAVNAEINKALLSFLCEGLDA